MDRNILTCRRDPVALQAAEWMLELQNPDVGEERLSAWQAWLARDARHRQAFDSLQAVQECIDTIPELPWPSDAEVAADAAASRPWTSRRAVHALAASIVAAVSIGVGVYGSRGHEIQTSVGELRRIPLPDGSILTAGGHSVLSVQFASTRREIRLEQGEAFFEVAPDAARPFVVHAGTASIRALGTSFTVRRAGDHVVVAVAEGMVETVDPAGGAARLSAGQQVRLGAGTDTVPVTLATDTIAAWREGRRQYRAEPLSDVIADLARYSPRRIVIEDAATGALSITGTVFEKEIDKWLHSLESALPVEVTEGPNGQVRISARR